MIIAVVVTLFLTRRLIAPIRQLMRAARAVGAGKLDVYVVNANGSPILYRNVTVTPGHWLEMRLVGTTSNRDACGASVKLTSGTDTWARWVLCGDSLGAGSDRALHFGGIGSGSYTLDITWPSGDTQRVLGTSVDHQIVVIEP